MATQIENLNDLNNLDDQQATNLLSIVLENAGLMNPASITQNISKEALQNVSQQMESEIKDTTSENHTDMLPARQALNLIYTDPLLRSTLQNIEITKLNFYEKPKQFNIDITTAFGGVTLAMILLSTYVNVERDKEGKWNFQFKIKPSSDSIKRELINLLKSLINTNPNKTS